MKDPEAEVANADARAPRPGRLKLVIIGVAVFMAAALLTAAIILFRDSRQVDMYFERGNARYDRAFSELETALHLLATIKVDNNPGEVESASSKMIARIDRAKNHLDGAGKDFEEMGKISFSKGEARVAELMTASVSEAKKGTVELEEKIMRLGLLSKMLGQVAQASNKFNAAFSKNNEAIKAGNDDKFASARDQAAESHKLFSEAKALLALADETARDPALAAIVSDLGKAQSWAMGAEQMLSAGALKQTDKYNELAKKNNQLSAVVNELAREAVLADPNRWMRETLDKFNTRIEKLFEKADRDRERALKLWAGEA